MGFNILGNRTANIYKLCRSMNINLLQCINNYLKKSCNKNTLTVFIVIYIIIKKLYYYIWKCEILIVYCNNNLKNIQYLTLY